MKTVYDHWLSSRLTIECHKSHRTKFWLRSRWRLSAKRLWKTLESSNSLPPIMGKKHKTALVTDELLTEFHSPYISEFHSLYTSDLDLAGLMTSPLLVRDDDRCSKLNTFIWWKFFRLWAAGFDWQTCQYTCRKCGCWRCLGVSSVIKLVSVFRFPPSPGILDTFWSSRTNAEQGTYQWTSLLENIGESQRWVKDGNTHGKGNGSLN
jgi:hypothetical protein